MVSWLRSHIWVLLLLGFLAILQARHLQRDWNQGEPGRGLAHGEPVPRFVTREADGGVIDLQQHLGQFVLVTFWASWCTPCLAEMPEIAGLVDEWEKLSTRHHEISVIAINVREDPEDAALQLNDPRYSRFSFGFDRDGTLSGLWRVNTLPSLFLIGPDGKLLDSTSGYEPNVRFRLLGLMGAHDDPGNAP